MWLVTGSCGYWPFDTPCDVPVEVADSEGGEVTTRLRREGF